MPIKRHEMLRHFHDIVINIGWENRFSSPTRSDWLPIVLPLHPVCLYAQHVHMDISFANFYGEKFCFDFVAAITAAAVDVPRVAIHSVYEIDVYEIRIRPRLAMSFAFSVARACHLCFLFLNRNATNVSAKSWWITLFKWQNIIAVNTMWQFSVFLFICPVNYFSFYWNLLLCSLVMSARPLVRSRFIQPNANTEPNSRLCYDFSMT